MSAAGGKSPAALLVQGPSSEGEPAQRGADDNDIVLGEDSSTDSGLDHARNSTTDTELADSSRKLIHSSSTDSGLSLSSYSDTGVSKNPVSDLTMKGSYSGESGMSFLCDDDASVTECVLKVPPVAPESPGPAELARGVRAVSELLQDVLPSGVPPPATRPCPPDHADAGDSDPPAAGGVRTGSASAGAAGDVSVMDLGDSGSEMSLLVAESAPERSLVHLSARGTDLGTNGTDLGTNGTDLGTREAYLVASKGDLGASEGGLEASEVNLGTSKTDLGGVKLNPGTSESYVATGATGLGASEMDLCGGTSDPGGGEADQGVLGTDVDVGDADRHVEAAERGVSRPGTGASDAPLLELESVAESSQLVASHSVSVLPTPPSTPLGLLVTAESDYAAAGGEPLSSVSQPTPDSLSAQEHRSALLIRRGPGQVSSLSRGIAVGISEFPQEIRGRGQILESARKVLGAAEKYSEPIRDIVNIDDNVPEDMREVPHIEGNATKGLNKVLEAPRKSETLGAGKDQPEHYELDSDDSEDSWDAGFRPGHRLEDSLSGSAQ